MSKEVKKGKKKKGAGANFMKEIRCAGPLLNIFLHLDSAIVEDIFDFRAYWFDLQTFLPLSVTVATIHAI
jgi:hypothetical protein